MTEKPCGRAVKPWTNLKTCAKLNLYGIYEGGFFPMSKKAVYYPQGVCSRQYEITLSDDNIIEDIVIIGGCNGNLQGISRLIKGRPAAEVAETMLGVDCGGRGTSCPDQIAKALKKMLA
jgi:uncharacterized protein (TIGR03905 family)